MVTLWIETSVCDDEYIVSRCDASQYVTMTEYVNICGYVTKPVCRFSRQQEEEDTDDNVVEVVSDNVLETSYHLKTGTIDILLCDDETSSNRE